MEDGVKLRTSEYDYTTYGLANVGDRILAFLIDSLIKVAFLAILGVFSFSIFRGGFPFPGVLFTLVMLLPIIFYSLIFEALTDGQTPGKKAMNIKVVKTDGSEPSFGDYFLRWFFRIIDINMMGGAIGLLTIAFSEKGQRVGDMVANTAVINMNKELDAIYEDDEFLELEYDPKFRYISRLNNGDAQAIRRALNDNSVEAFSQRILLAREFEDILDVEKDLNSEDFLREVLRDYVEFEEMKTVNYR